MLQPNGCLMGRRCGGAGAARWKMRWRGASTRRALATNLPGPPAPQAHATMLWACIGRCGVTGGRCSTRHPFGAACIPRRAAPVARGRAGPRCHGTCALQQTNRQPPPVPCHPPTKQAVEDYQQTLEAQGALGPDTSPDLVSVRLPRCLALHAFLLRTAPGMRSSSSGVHTAWRTRCRRDSFLAGLRHTRACTWGIPPKPPVDPPPGVGAPSSPCATAVHLPGLHPGHPSQSSNPHLVSNNNDPCCPPQFICLAFYQKEMALYVRKNLDRWGCAPFQLAMRCCFPASVRGCNCPQAGALPAWAAWRAACRRPLLAARVE